MFSLTKILKNKCYSLLKNNNPLSDFSIKLISKKYKLVQRKFIREHKNILNDNKNIFSSKDLTHPGSKMIFGTGFDNVKLLKNMNSVAGYIPFKINSTKIFIYNFFGRNYAIRKQFLGTVTLLSKEKIISQVWFLLPVDAVQEISCNDLFKDKIGDYIVIELYHPKLFVNHAGHDGHLRFWGVYGDNHSTVHSSPISSILLKSHSGKSTRRYIPHMTLKTKDKYKLELISFFGKKVINISDNIGDFSNKIIHPMGYNSLDVFNKSNNNSNAIATWHDAILINEDHKKEYVFQVISIPPIKGVNAILFFLEALKSETKIKLHYFDKNNKNIFDFCLSVHKNSEINPLEFLKNKNYIINYIVIEFIENVSTVVHGYVNCFYTFNNKLCDNVHCHPASSSKIIYKNNTLKSNSVGIQSLKFMHFPPQNHFDSYVSIWGNNFETKIKLRFILSDFSEKVIETKINPYILTTFNLEEIFKQNGISLNLSGVVQFECYEGNSPANLMTINHKNETLSVDHFTGG